MVLSWALTEVVRYSYYACSLLGHESRLLVFLRYTLFYILYPTGASSEAFLIYATLPHPAFGLHADLHTNVRELLFAIWWPGKWGAFVYGDARAGFGGPAAIALLVLSFVVRAVCDVHTYDQAAAQGARGQPPRWTDWRQVQVFLISGSVLAFVLFMGYL